MTGRVATAKKTAQSTDIDEVPPPTLDLVERQMIAALYAIWRAQGVKKKIVSVESNANKETPTPPE